MKLLSIMSIMLFVGLVAADLTLADEKGIKVNEEKICEKAPYEYMGKDMQYGADHDKWMHGSYHMGWMHGGYIFAKVLLLGFFFWLLYSIHHSLKEIAEVKKKE